MTYGEAFTLVCNAFVEDWTNQDSCNTVTETAVKFIPLKMRRELAHRFQEMFFCVRDSITIGCDHKKVTKQLGDKVEICEECGCRRQYDIDEDDDGMSWFPKGKWTGWKIW